VLYYTHPWDLDNPQQGHADVHFRCSGKEGGGHRFNLKNGHVYTHTHIYIGV